MASSSGEKRAGSASFESSFWCCDVAEWNDLLELVDAFEVLRGRRKSLLVEAVHPEGRGDETRSGSFGGLTRSGRVFGPVALNDMISLLG